MIRELLNSSELNSSKNQKKSIICIQESTNNYVFHELSGNIKDKENFISDQGILRVVPTNSLLYNSLLILENPETRVPFFKICRKQWFTENVYTLYSSGREHNLEMSLSTGNSLPIPVITWNKVATLKRSVHLNTYQYAKTSSLLNYQYYLLVDPNYGRSLTLTYSENYHLLTARNKAEDNPFFTYHSLVGPIGRGGGLLTLYSTKNWIFATAVCTVLLGIQEEIYRGHLVATRPINIEEMQKLLQKYWDEDVDGVGVAEAEGEVVVNVDALNLSKPEEKRKSKVEEKEKAKVEEKINLVVNMTVGRVGEDWKAGVKGVVVLKDVPKKIDTKEKGKDIEEGGVRRLILN